MESNVVLAVEDEALVLIELEDSLAAAGFEVVTARNAVQALSAFDADPTRFKAVLTDIRLGDGPNGWDIGRCHVRGTAPTMPVIYINGDSAADWHAQGGARKHHDIQAIRSCANRYGGCFTVERHLWNCLRPPDQHR
ncbi:response regulator [Mesorhizobium silamurunense]|uniref:response regulator n=1 Tax=Mesorhizobium silamurunense TaxID=499528 RepID=UPI001FE79CA3|nr:response regulator [Mesorhizobium silamurunense]